MSDLILSYDGIHAPPRACIDPPPASGIDPCHFELPLVDDTDPSARPHVVRFDRQGDQFILSPSNAGDTLTWVASHRNLPALLQTLRITQHMIRGTDLVSSDSSARIFFIIANYVATGEVRAPGSEGEVMDRAQLANGLLDIFTDSSDRGLTDFLGRLTVMRGQDWLGTEARERLRWVVDVMDFGPQHRTFRRHFINEAEYANFESLPPDRRRQLQAITNFCRELIVAQALGRPLRYSRSFLEANEAYQAIYQTQLESGMRLDFCTSMEDALRELRGDRGLPPRFVEDCREALRLVELPREDAARESLRAQLLGEEGLARMQESIASESSDANMTVDWLVRQVGRAEGGRIGEVFRILLDHADFIAPAEEGGAPSVTRDVAAFQLDLTTLIDGQTLNRREYILSALALLRTAFGSAGNPPALRVFWEGEHREASWQFSGEALQDLRRLSVSVNSRLVRSEAASDLWLPILEGSVCALGAAGLALSHTLPQVTEDHDLQLSLGATSAGLAGAGCSSLIGHFLWPEVAPDSVHNAYLWDGLTGLGGAVLGAGLYLLISLLTGGQGPGMTPSRFPVDEFGP